jgi:chemotaxis protein CheD
LDIYNHNDKTEIHVLAGLIKYDSSPKRLQILGLGSCVAICFYSEQNKFGALAHVMLPSSTNAKTPELKGKYADLAVKELVSIFRRKKISKKNITIKIVGGSSMFAKFKRNSFDIASRNIEAIKEQLATFDLKVSASDLGGTKGRTINFYLEDGSIKIYNAGGKLRKII